MAVFLADAFTDPDATELSAHAPDVGGIWTKRAGTANLEILSNALVSDGSLWVYYSNSAAPGNNQYDVSIDITKGTGTPRALGVIARYVDFSNFYHARYDSVAQAYRIRKKVSGAYTELATFGEALPSGTDTFKFEIRNAAKKIYYGGVEKCSTVDDALTADGVVGFQWQLNYGNNDWVMDNLLCDVSGAVTGAAVISGVGTMTAVGGVTRSAAAVFTGVGAMAAAGIKGSVLSGAAAIAGVGAMAAAGAATRGGQAVISGVGSMAAKAERVMPAAAAMAGVGSMSARGEVSGTLEGRAAMAGIGSMSAHAERLVAGGAVFTGEGAMGARAVITVVGVASMSGVGSMVAAGESGVILYTQMGKRTFDIDPADYPTGTLFYLEANMEAEGGGQEAYVRLYNITNAEEVAGSPIVIPGPGPAWVRSGNFSLAADVKRYRVEYGGTTGGIITPHGAALRVASS